MLRGSPTGLRTITAHRLQNALKCYSICIRRAGHPTTSLKLNKTSRASGTPSFPIENQEIILMESDHAIPVSNPHVDTHQRVAGSSPSVNQALLARSGPVNTNDGILHNSVAKFMHRRAKRLQAKERTFRRAVEVVEGSRKVGENPHKQYLGSSKREGRLLARHRGTLFTTKSADDAWEAYQAILYASTSPTLTPHTSASPKLPPGVSEDSQSLVITSPNEFLPNSSNSSSKSIPSTAISIRELYAIARVLAGTHPRTRTLFLRLLSVLSRIRAQGGEVDLWAWNALIDCAGSNLRKTRVIDYKTALGVYEDMMRENERIEQQQRQRDDELVGPRNDLPDNLENLDVKSRRILSKTRGIRFPVQPDIVTYTTLLKIAVRTQSTAAIRHATLLMQNSNFVRTPLTILAPLPHRIRTEGLRAVRATYEDLLRNGFEIDLNAVNTFLWEFGKEGNLEVMLEIYNALRRNAELLAKKRAHEGTVRTEDEEDRASVIEGIIIPRTITPDNVTYNTVIQTLSYRGRLLDSFKVFTDFLSDDDQGRTDKASLSIEDPQHNGLAATVRESNTNFKHTFVIFRALFCGYAKYAKGPPRGHRQSFAGSSSSSLSLLHHQTTEWNAANLDILFDAFLELPSDTKPTERMAYWVMTAYEKVYPDDKEKLIDVWNRMVNRYKVRLVGRLAKMGEKYARPHVRGSSSGSRTQENPRD